MSRQPSESLVSEVRHSCRDLLPLAATVALFLVTAICFDSSGPLIRRFLDLDGTSISAHGFQVSSDLTVTSGGGHPHRVAIECDDIMVCAEEEDTDSFGESPGRLAAGSASLAFGLPDLVPPAPPRAPIRLSPPNPGLVSRRF